MGSLPVARTRAALAVVTTLGWTIAVIGAASWWLGAQLGWEELLILAGGCIVAIVLALLSTVGPLGLDIEVDVEPRRIEVGGDAVGQVRVTNQRRRPAFGTRVEVPVGAGVAAFEVGALRPGNYYEEPFVVPTNRRSVVTIGPARSVKGDALGIARREVVSGSTVELFVHPRTTVLPPLAAGWIRDLEGQTTNDLSTSDVAFHTLREYVPGDDRRHIHWRTTARLGTMMVRQFLDTRRSHLGVVLGTDATLWADEDEFELGISIAGSLARTALLEEQALTVLDGARVLPSATPPMLLDALSGIEQAEGEPSLRDLVRRSLHPTRAASVVALVIGSSTPRADVRAASDLYGPDVAVLALRCRPGAEMDRTRTANVSVLDIGTLADLARLLAVTGATQ